MREERERKRQADKTGSSRDANGRDENGRFAKGNSGNPNGRPRAPEVEELRAAISAAQKKHNRSILVHFVERAYEDDHVLIALIKKLIPDKISEELKIEGLETLAESIQRARVRLSGEKNAK